MHVQRRFDKNRTFEKIGLIDTNSVIPFVADNSFTHQNLEYASKNARNVSKLVYNIKDHYNHLRRGIKKDMLAISYGVEGELLDFLQDFESQNNILAQVTGEGLQDVLDKIPVIDVYYDETDPEYIVNLFDEYFKRRLFEEATIYDFSNSRVYFDTYSELDVNEELLSEEGRQYYKNLVNKYKPGRVDKDLVMTALNWDYNLIYSLDFEIAVLSNYINARFKKNIEVDRIVNGSRVPFTEFQKKIGRTSLKM